jgi:hypothetical protein
MRCARTAQSATKCLRCFIGRPIIPATGPPDEARSFQPKAVQGWGQVQINPGLSLSLDEERGSRQRFSGTKLAHHIVSSARQNELIENVIEDGPDGTSSYLIDMPIGGSMLLDHNVLEKSSAHRARPCGIFAWPAVMSRASERTTARRILINPSDGESAKCSAVRHQHL